MTLPGTAIEATRPLSMKNVTVGIKTFMRPEALAECLEGLRDFEFANIIVADDNPPTYEAAYQKVYDFYGKVLQLHVLRLPHDLGVAASRNRIAAATNTEFLLLLDDDQVINSTVTLLYDVLVSDAHIGGVAGFFHEKKGEKCSACDIYFENEYIVKELRRVPSKYYTEKRTEYSLFDFIPSATLFRLQCLEDVPWDPYYKTGAEHLDFYVCQKQLGKWKFAVAPDAYIDHIRYDRDEYNSTAYLAERKGPKFIKSWEHFNAKFSVRGKIEGHKLKD